jgi:hypothetical protein
LCTIPYTFVTERKALKVVYFMLNIAKNVSSRRRSFPLLRRQLRLRLDRLTGMDLIVWKGDTVKVGFSRG